MPEISQTLRNKLVVNGYSVASFERLDRPSQLLVCMHLLGGKATARDMADALGLDVAVVLRLLEQYLNGGREKMA